jgi:protein TonB
MRKERKPESFIKQPKYPGGKKAMDEFISSNMQYPEEALKNKVAGSVSVNYDVDVFGNVSDVKVKHGIGYGCDEEAVRLVKMLHYEKKKYQGLRVTFHKNIIIHFRLPGAVPQQGLVINYQYTESTPSPSAGGNISYTIIPDKK